MFSSNLSTMIISELSSRNFASISFQSQLSPFPVVDPTPSSRFNFCKFQTLPSIQNGIRELQERIETVKNTQKLTEAMKLVAAARVRRAQEAVINSRPFSETLVEVLYELNQQCQLDDVEIPLTVIRPVKKVALVVITGDRGLCGGFNNAIMRKVDARISELKNLGLDHTLIGVGLKGNVHFSRRPDVNVDRFIRGEIFPTSKEAQVITDAAFSLFLSEEVDKVELLYTKFVSLIKSDPVIHPLLPLSAKGKACDVNGKSVDASEDEFFRLTTKGGKLIVERDHTMGRQRAKILPNYEFEQDPAQILDALIPLYLNSQILKALQESYASELTARMNAMSSATDNAVKLKRSLSIAYNRERQEKITGEILEIVAGAEALMWLQMGRYYIANADKCHVEVVARICFGGGGSKRLAR